MVFRDQNFEEIYRAQTKQLTFAKMIMPLHATNHNISFDQIQLLKFQPSKNDTTIL